jgi:hypothetical protein
MKSMQDGKLTMKLEWLESRWEDVQSNWLEVIDNFDS